MRHLNTRMEAYIKKIKAFANNLDPEAQVELESIYSNLHYSKGSYLLQAGQVCCGHYLIQKGIARKFYYGNDKEITTEIFFADDVAVSLDSYISQKGSTVYVEALTDLSVTLISREKFQAAQHKFPQLIALEKLFIEYYAVWFEKRLQEFQTMDATQRYLSLLEKSPYIVQTIPLTIIASYLNISLETLSRIRARI